MKAGIFILFALLAAGPAVDGQTNAAAHAAPAAPSRQIPYNPLPFAGVLTEEQRKLFAAGREANWGKIQALNAQIRSLRREMSDLMLAPQFDEAAYRAKSEAIGKLQAEIDLLAVRPFVAIRPLLTTNQVEQIRNTRGAPRAETPSPAAPSAP
jgi:Spy/CpxP family protein refolding chaperone